MWNVGAFEGDTDDLFGSTEEDAFTYDDGNFAPGGKFYDPNMTPAQANALTGWARNQLTLEERAEAARITAEKAEQEAAAFYGQDVPTYRELSRDRPDLYDILDNQAKQNGGTLPAVAPWAKDKYDEARITQQLFESDVIKSNPGITQAELDARTADATRRGSLSRGMAENNNPYSAYVEDIRTGHTNTITDIIKGVGLADVPGASTPEDLRDIDIADLTAMFGDVSGAGGGNFGSDLTGVNEAGERAFIQALAGSQAGQDLNFRGAQSLLDDTLSGAIFDQPIGQTLSQHFPEILASVSPVVGPVSTLASLFGSFMGEDVIGTITDPVTGKLMSVHESGKVQYISPEDQPGFDPESMEFGNEPINRFPNFQAGQVAGPPGSPFNRSTFLDELIASTQAGTINPGIADSYFDQIIRDGILTRNEGLGPDASEDAIRGEFGSSILGDELLSGESQRLRDVSTGNIGKVFTGQAFNPITDDDAINNILNEQINAASGDVARFAARGNLNATGGKTANAFLQNQRPEAQTRLESIGSSVRGSNQRLIDDISNRAIGEANAFNLGDELFNLAPFIGERQTLIGERTPQLEGDIRTQLGAEQLFDTRTALSEASTKQGLVSGAPSFLDEIAGKQGSAALRKRGVGTRGSGVF